MRVSDAPEVRLCPSCGQTAVVLVNDWKHTTNFGGATGESTQDFRCQECGKTYVKPPRSKVIAYWILGVIFLPTCGLGLVFLYLARRHSKFDQRVQVVQGAPLPQLRFPGGPPERTCGKCEGVARATQTTRHTHNGVPTGTDHVYTCGKCGLTFEIEDALGHGVAFFGASLLLGGAAAFFFIAQSAGWKWGGGIVCTLIAGFVFWQGGERIANRFKHKPIARALPPLSQR